MDICDNDHEYVAYSNSIACPVCDLRDEKNDELEQLTQERDDALKEAEDYLVEVDRLRVENESYKALKEKLEAMVHERL